MVDFSTFTGIENSVVTTNICVVWYCVHCCERIIRVTLHIKNPVESVLFESWNTVIPWNMAGVLKVFESRSIFSLPPTLRGPQDYYTE